LWDPLAFQKDVTHAAKDEATSALDSTSEKMIQKTIDDLGKTLPKQFGAFVESGEPMRTHGNPSEPVGTTHGNPGKASVL